MIFPLTALVFIATLKPTGIWYILAMKIVTAEQMREIDRACVRRGTPASALMENAGKAVAEETRRFLGALEFHHVLCLVGGGNNGGDGLVAARYLKNGAPKLRFTFAPNVPPMMPILSW